MTPLQRIRAQVKAIDPAAKVSAAENRLYVTVFDYDAIGRVVETLASTGWAVSADRNGAPMLASIGSRYRGAWRMTAAAGGSTPQRSPRWPAADPTPEVACNRRVVYT